MGTFKSWPTMNFRLFPVLWKAHILFRFILKFHHKTELFVTSGFPSPPFVDDGIYLVAKAFLLTCIFENTAQSFCNFGHPKEKSTNSMFSFILYHWKYSCSAVAVSFPTSFLSSKPSVTHSVPRSAGSFSLLKGSCFTALLPHSCSDKGIDYKVNYSAYSGGHPDITRFFVKKTNFILNIHEHFN